MRKPSRPAGADGRPDGRSLASACRPATGQRRRWRRRASPQVILRRCSIPRGAGGRRGWEGNSGAGRDCNHAPGRPGRGGGRLAALAGGCAGPTPAPRAAANTGWRSPKPSSLGNRQYLVVAAYGERLFPARRLPGQDQPDGRLGDGTRPPRHEASALAARLGSAGALALERASPPAGPGGAPRRRRAAAAGGGARPPGAKMPDPLRLTIDLDGAGAATSSAWPCRS